MQEIFARGHFIMAQQIKEDQNPYSTSSNELALVSDAAPSNELLECALKYAARGWHVFPIRQNCKKPLTATGFKDATTDAEQIKTWWANYPKANIGIALDASGLCVIDVDTHGDVNGFESLPQLGELPETIIARTPSGGAHYVFNNDGDQLPRKVGLVKGIDLLANGYFLVAPSAINGRPYKWDAKRVPIATFPQHVRDMAAPTQQPVNTTATSRAPTMPDRNSLNHRASLWLAQAEAAYQGQAGHSKLLWAAQGLVNGFQLSRSDALGLLWSEYNPRCVPAWDQSKSSDVRDFERKVDQALANPVKETGWLLSESDYFKPSESERAAMDAIIQRCQSSDAGTPAMDESAAIAEAAEEEHSESIMQRDLPVPLPERRQVDKMDADMLPPVVAGWAKDVAVRSSCPFEYAAVGGLMALSAALGKSVAVLPKRKDSWHEYGNLWGMCVGSPSAMKSHPLKEMLKPVEAMQITKAELIRGEIEKWNKDAAVVALKNEAIKNDNRKRLKAAMDAGEDTDSVSLTEAVDLPPKPAEPCYLAKDITPEKLEVELQTNPRGITVYRDELRGLLASFTKSGHESARTLYLSGWSGKEALDTKRMSREKVSLSSYALGVVGTIQPGPLGEFVSESGTKSDDGFMQRFGLMVWPDEMGAFKSVDQAPDLRARRAYVDCIKRLGDVNQGGQKIGYEVEGVKGAAIRFSPDAAAYFDQWTCSHMNRIRLENGCEALESHLGKYKKVVPALALLFHVSTIGGADSTADIERDSVERAVRLANVLESHARKVYSDEIAPEIKAAKALLSLAKEVSAETPVWRARDIYRRQRKGLKTAADVDQAAKMLIDYGHLFTAAHYKSLKQGQYTFNLMYHPE